MQRSRLGYAVLMLIAGGFYGLTSPILKLGYQAGFDTQDMTNAQYGFAAVILWLLSLLSWRKQRFSWRNIGYLLGIGLTGAATSYCYYRALTLLPASLGIVLLFQFSWMVMVIDILVTKRMPSVEKWLGMAMIMAGTSLAVGLTGSNIAAMPPLWVVGLGLLAGLFYALTLYLSGYIGSESTPVMRTAIIVSISVVALLPVFPPTYLTNGALWRGLWMWGSLMALVGQVVPMLLMLIAIPRIGGRMAGVLGSIELPVAVLAASLILGEAVQWTQWIGVLLIIGGICVSELLSFHAPAASKAN